VWLVLLAVTRVSSLAGMSAAVAAPIVAVAFGRWEFVPVLAAIAVIVLLLHRENIARLLAGTEPKVGRAK
jgi:glycerol-3-phosphate acyltransferase PlsY